VGWDALRLDRIARLDSMGLVTGTDPVLTRNPFVPAWKDIPQGDFYPGYHAMTSDKHDQDDWDSKMAVYAAQVSCMDENIGRIVNRLKELGQYDNTLIMFLQDNGGCAEAIGKDDSIYPGGPDSYNAYDLPWAYLSNTPFRMYKHFMHEGGISTPFIVYWPDGIPDERKGVIEKESFGQLVDILPTCLDAAGVDDAELDYPLEGMSLLGVIRGQEDNSDRQLFWEHEGNRAVRKGDWKLVSRYEDDVRYFQKWEFPIDPRTQEWELYNIADDRWELNELSGVHPGIVDELKKDYEDYYQRVGAIPRKEVIKGSNQEF
jgi:arylsulfatase A-like enzyme